MVSFSIPQKSSLKIKWPSSSASINFHAKFEACSTLRRQFYTFCRKRKTVEPIIPTLAIDNDALAVAEGHYYGNNTSCSLEGKDIDTEVVTNLNKNCMENFENEVQNPFCEICLENKESWEMFVNDKCSHSFCYACTINHILAKINNHAKTITCPGVNCKAVLNSSICRLLIADDALVKWDEILCHSLIPEAEKLYCPFQDCSSMLINDTGEIVKNVRCPACMRSFCSSCRIPWHQEFTCKEFQKLYGKKGGKDEKIVKFLAKKKKWQKCPKCRIYVERAEGCEHITCRCKYEFCYTCGANWTHSHTCKWKYSAEKLRLNFVRILSYVI